MNYWNRSLLYVASFDKNYTEFLKLCHVDINLSGHLRACHPTHTLIDASIDQAHASSLERIKL